MYTTIKCELVSDASGHLLLNTHDLNVFWLSIDYILTSADNILSSNDQLFMLSLQYCTKKSKLLMIVVLNKILKLTAMKAWNDIFVFWKDLNVM